MDNPDIEQPVAKRPKILDHHELRKTIVTVYVGPSRVPFYFHKEQLCSASPFFNSAFNGAFIEGQSSSMELPDDEVDVIKAFEAIISPGTAMLTTSSQDIWDSTSEDWMLLPIKTFIFADKVDCVLVQSFILNSVGAIILPDSKTNQVSEAAVQLAFSSLQPGSHLRQLMVDVFVLHSQPSDIGSIAGKYHDQFVAAVLCLMKARFWMRKANKKMHMNWGKYVECKAGEHSPLHTFSSKYCEDVEIYTPATVERVDGMNGPIV